MAKPIKIEAIKLNQKTKKGSEVFVASIQIKSLLDLTSFKVNWWNKDKMGAKDQGYQREPAETRKKKIGNYLVNYDQPIFPASIVLASRSKIKFTYVKGNAGFLSISSENYPLWVVDGQTRIEGFRYTVKELGFQPAENYDMPVTIITNLELLDELEQFYVLNSTQKKVNTALAQRLKLELAREHGLEKFMSMKIGEEWEPKAIMVTDLLNSKSKSEIWYGRIQLPNTKKSPINIIPQTSFVTSLKPLFKDGLLKRIKSVDICAEYLREYWMAVRDHFQDAFELPKDYVIQKTPGVFILHSLAVSIFDNLYHKHQKIDRVNIYKELNYAFTEDMTSNWWMKESHTGAATAGSMKGFKRLSDRFKENLPVPELKK